MIYLKEFDSHSSYETEVNGVGVDFKIPNVSYCNDVNDVHFNPYNLIEFYVGNITTPQIVSIYTDLNTSVDITVSKGNKWYSYLLPKDNGLYRIEGGSVKKVVVKSDIVSNYESYNIIPTSVVEASFKGSNTSNVTDMSSMFNGCSSLTSLDVSNFNTSNVTSMYYMFYGCNGLTSLDLSGWNTSKVNNMNSMFSNCNNLTSLDLSNFNTSNVTNMSWMFYGCTSLTSLTLSDWVISDATDTSYMFDGCGKLSTITMKGCTQETRTKIEEALTAARIKDNVTIETT